jgi:hypothetical protein
MRLGAITRLDEIAPGGNHKGSRRFGQMKKEPCYELTLNMTDRKTRVDTAIVLDFQKRSAARHADATECKSARLKRAAGADP